MKPEDEKLGLIAGGDRFPLLLARTARQMGVKEIVAVCFPGQTSPRIEEVADKTFWINIGQFGKLIKTLKNNGVRRAVMAGRIDPAIVIKKVRLDLKGLMTLPKIKDRRADSILKVVAEELEAAGVSLVDSTLYLKPVLPGAGVLSSRSPKRGEKEDIKFGWEIAKGIGKLDIGQTVVVKQKAVVAVEAIEGTDRVIRRGGDLAGPGTVVVKVCKPEQDMRFDVLTIGLKTMESLLEAGSSVLAVEAEKTLFLDREEALGKADEAGIAIVAVDADSLNFSSL